LTLPSHASILTGNYPPTHGIRDNATSRLAESQLTLSEALRSSGYETAAFLGSFVLDERFGLAQGFDTYDDQVAMRPEELESLEAERSAEDVFSAFDSWLSAREAEPPFFAWLHFYDPHAPYSPPEPFATRYRTDPYAGEVAYVDEVIGRVVGRLEEEGLLSKAVIAVVGDHGEGLGEHGERTHSLLIYNSTLHVPMILFAPGLIEPGNRIDSLVRTIDLAPTLLELADHAQGFGEGRSLMPLIDMGDANGQKNESDLVPSAYSESMYARLNLGWSSMRGLETETHRLILGPEPELYDTRVDPEEQQDVAASQDEVVKQMTQLLDELGPEPEPSELESMPSEVDPETIEQLRSLGYMVGSSTPGDVIGKDGEVNPRKFIGDWERIEEGLQYYAQDDFAKAAERFEAVLKVHPETPLLYEYLGSCYERLGKPSAAEQVYRKALAGGLESSEFHLGMARIAMEKGESRAAEKQLLTALDLDPLSVVGLHTLGDVYRGRRDFHSAQKHYRAALEINPSYVYSWNGLGMSLGSQGDDDGALEAFQKAVDVSPESPLPYMNLAVQLERMGKTYEARTNYQKFLARSEELSDLARERTLATQALQRLGM
jgi:arylsulfatase A-like enzyme/Tfp pilus assembly protein PilF